MGCRRVLLAALAAVFVAAGTGCSSAPGPGSPSPTASPAPTATSGPGPSATIPTGTSPPTAPSSTEAPTASATAEEGTTLRELGFENGPLDDFSVPSDAVVSTRVDQPNVVTIVLARPSPPTVEQYLRTTLPGEGFTIGARGGPDGGAMTFEGNGWRGGFTGTAATSAIVLRPA